MPRGEHRSKRAVAAVDPLSEANVKRFDEPPRRLLSRAGHPVHVAAHERIAEEGPAAIDQRPGHALEVGEALVRAGHSMVAVDEARDEVMDRVWGVEPPVPRHGMLSAGYGGGLRGKVRN